jgi:hypothetical protein
MRKKAEPKQMPSHPPSAPVVPPEILEPVKYYALDTRPKKTFKCRVCGADGATEQSESLCWVCRRLKISAWREADQQASMSE